MKNQKAELEEDHSNFDLIILGAGVTGMTIAHEMSKRGQRVLVLESSSNAGGNQISRSIGKYTFDIGAFVFGKNDPFFVSFPDALTACQDTTTSVEKLTPQSRIAKYPFDLRIDLIDRGPGHWIASLVSLVCDRVRYRTPKHTGQFIRFHLGGWLYQETGLSKYIERLFGCPARQLSLTFAKSRMTWVVNAGSIRQRLKQFRVRPPAPASPVVRPRQGFAAMYNPAIEQLRNGGVIAEFGVKIVSIRKHGNCQRIDMDEGRAVFARKLVSTLPPAVALPLVGDNAPVDLSYVDLLTLYFDANEERGFSAPILYNFHPDSVWKRTTVHSDYYGVIDGKCYFSVEVPFHLEIDTYESEQSVKKHMQGSGLFTEMRLIGYDITRCAYPVHNLEASTGMSETQKRLADAGILSAGRQGNFDYLPTARATAQKALVFSDTLPV